MTIYGHSFSTVLPAREADEPFVATPVGYIVVTNEAGALNGPLNGFPIIITEWQVSFTEKVGVLESFNEHVHAYAFGKGVGTAVIGGRSLESATENFEHEQANNLIVGSYNDKFRALAAAKAGRLTRISGPGGLVISGVARSLSMSLAANPSNVLQFQMQFIILDSALGVCA